MRKTKIICTVGPATDDEAVLEELMKHGMNVARCNFSHGTYDEHKKRFDTIKRLREKLGLPVAILLDTKGPEIRVKTFKNGSVVLEDEQIFTLHCSDDEAPGDETGVAVSYVDLWRDVKEDTRILLDDGMIEMVVTDVKGRDIVCRVVNGGKLSDRKGVNIPDAHINMDYLSEQDRQDIVFGIENDVDFVAASFVRSADDVKLIRNVLNVNGGKNIDIIAKIENSEGIKNIDEIIENSQGIMVARGDMGVEIPEEQVPAIQKMIIKKVYNAGKIAITATQMLDSMITRPRPTRAETADVANAVYDGTSAVMLSGETAAGAYPVQALDTMVRIAEKTEQDINYRMKFMGKDKIKETGVTEAICHATCMSAYHLNASAILTVTKTGYSAKMISKYRPECMIIAGTTEEKTYRKLSLSWGVIPLMTEEKDDILELFDYAEDMAKGRELIEKGDKVVVTAGIPLGIAGTTNMIKVDVV